jgi:hypothetical protein
LTVCRCEAVKVAPPLRVARLIDSFSRTTDWLIL